MFRYLFFAIFSLVFFNPSTQLKAKELSHNSEKEVTSQVESHTVENIFCESDPWTGETIFSYQLILDDSSIWTFSWSAYEKNDLSFSIGDRVQTIALSENQYLLIANTNQGEDKKAISFKRIKSTNNYLTSDNDI